MADITKDREEKLKFSVDFTDALDTGDSLSAVSSVEVVKRTADGWSDASAEFGPPTGTDNGDKVDITLDTAAADEQSTRYDYIVRVTVTTANSETLIATPSLEVTATGDTDAP